jgi:hypothetical protein
MTQVKVCTGFADHAHHPLGLWRQHKWPRLDSLSDHSDSAHHPLRLADEPPLCNGHSGRWGHFPGAECEAAVCVLHQPHLWRPRYSELPLLHHVSALLSVEIHFSKFRLVRCMPTIATEG